VCVRVCVCGCVRAYVWISISNVTNVTSATSPSQVHPNKSRGGPDKGNSIPDCVNFLLVCVEGWEWELGGGKGRVKTQVLELPFLDSARNFLPSSVKTTSSCLILSIV
jgi:hypothetical protein